MDPNSSDAFTLSGAAIADHEMYKSWRDAGFDREQAMVLLLNNKQMINQQIIEQLRKGEVDE